MGPTVIIVLVETKRSMTDIFEISPSNTVKFAGPVVSEARPVTLGHLPFAVGPVRSTADNQAESQRSRFIESRWTGT